MTKRKIKSVETDQKDTPNRKIEVEESIEQDIGDLYKDWKSEIRQQKMKQLSGGL